MITSGIGRMSGPGLDGEESLSGKSIPWVLALCPRWKGFVADVAFRNVYYAVFAYR